MPDGLRFCDVDSGVRATIARYVQALDDGRADAVAATFCADGVCEIPGMATFEGVDAIREGFAGWVPQRPQRHLVLNTVIGDWTDREARAVSDLVFILQGSAGWNIQMVGRYHDVFRRENDQWLILHRRAEFVAAP